MRTLLAEVEAHLANNFIDPIMLFRFDFGTVGVQQHVYYWSDRVVPAGIAFDSNPYEHRIIRAGDLNFFTGSEARKTSLIVDNTDLFLTNLKNVDGVDFDYGRVSANILFPSLSAPNNALNNSWTNPLWQGRVKQVKKWKREAFEFQITDGFLELSRPALRLFEDLCDHTYADGFHCPAEPSSGFGLPQPTVTGTSTAGSSTTLVDSAKDFVALGIVAGDSVVARNGSKKAFAAVDSVSGGTITVSSWGGDGPPGSGWKYTVGPDFTTCPFHVGGCIERGMFGVNDKQKDEDLNKVTRRWFGAMGPISDRAISVRETIGSAFLGLGAKGGDRFNSIAQGNQGLQGKPFRVAVGRVWILNAPAGAAFHGGDFLHAYIPVTEGRAGNLIRIEMNGDPPDNNDPTNPRGIVDDSLQLFNFNIFGANDQPGVDAGELTEEQRNRGAGAKQGFAALFRGTLDGYENNPWVFANDRGHGPSFSGSWVRLRTEPEGDFSITNISVAMLLSGGTLMLKPSGSWASLGLTPPDVAHDFLRAKVYGGGFAPEQIDTQSFIDAAAFCAAQIASTQGDFETFNGKVRFGPTDGESPVLAGLENWIFISGFNKELGVLSGSKLTVVVNSTPFERTVTHVVPKPSLDEHERDPFIEGGGFGFLPPEREVGVEGYFLFVDSPWDPGNIPSRGDDFTLETFTSVQRYTANGILEKDSPLGEMLSDILRNCNGDWYQAGGKVRCFVRNQEDLGEIDSRPTITDKGPNRNVIIRKRQRGWESTAEWSPKAVTEAPNAVGVEYPDRTRFNELTRKTVKNQNAQLRLKEKFGEDIREKISNTLSLGLTDTTDQAVRLAALYIRERGVDRQGQLRGEISFDMMIHDAAKFEPNDVYPCDLDGFPDFIQYIRIEKLKLNPDRFTMNVTGIPYVHGDYDDTADDVGLLDTLPALPPGSGAPGARPQSRITKLTEGQIVDRTGKKTQNIFVEVAPPLIGNLPIIKAGQPLPTGSIFSAGSSRLLRDENGQLVSAGVDVLRAPNYVNDLAGILIEPTRTNSITKSEKLDDAAWGKVRATVTPDVIAAPQVGGPLTVDKIVENTATGQHGVERVISGQANNTLQAISAFALPAERTLVAVWTNSKAGTALETVVDLSDGSIVGANNHNLVVVSYGSFYRLLGNYDSELAGNSFTLFRILLHNGSSTSYTGDGSSGLYAWGAQVEIDKPWPSSYQPTDASTVQRDGDLLKIPWGFPSEDMTGYLKFTAGGTIEEAKKSLFPRLFTISNAGDSNDLLRIILSPTAYLLEQVRGGSTDGSSTLSFASVNVGDVVELLCRVTLAEVQLQMRINGGTPVAGSIGSASAFSSSWGSHLRIMSSEADGVNLSNPLAFDVLHNFHWLKGDRGWEIANL